MAGRHTSKQSKSKEADNAARLLIETQDRIDRVSKERKIKADSQEIADVCNEISDYVEHFHLDPKLYKLPAHPDLEQATAIRDQARRALGHGHEKAALVKLIQMWAQFMELFGPVFHLNLAGYGQNVQLALPHADDTVAELAIKYRRLLHAGPEFRMIWLLGYSMFMCHKSNLDPAFKAKMEEAAKLASGAAVPVPDTVGL